MRIQLREIAQGNRGLEKVLKDVRNSLDAIETLPPRLQAAVRDGYAEATRFAFGFQLCTFVVAFFAGLGTKEVHLDI